MAHTFGTGCGCLRKYLFCGTSVHSELTTSSRLRREASNHCRHQPPSPVAMAAKGALGLLRHAGGLKNDSEKQQDRKRYQHVAAC